MEILDSTVVSQQHIVVDFTLANHFLADRTFCIQLTVVRRAFRSHHLRNTDFLFAVRSIQTGTVSSLEAREDFVSSFQLTVSLVRVVNILTHLQDIIRIGYTIRSEIIILRVERVIQILKTNDADVARNLIQRVQRRQTLTGRCEVVLLCRIVYG